MTQSSENGELTTTLPLLVPLWLLSILTGVVLTFSTFFGATLGIAVVLMLSYCVYRMYIAKRFTVKVLEAQLLSALIPILGAASVLASIYYPIATLTINVLLVSIALPHLLLLLRTSEKMNHLNLLAFASLMLIINPICFSFSVASPFSIMLPFTTITIFALVTLCRAIFLIREKVSIRALKFASLALALVCSIATVYFYLYAFPRFWRSLVEALACTLLFGYLDFLQYQMRTPCAKWTYATLQDAFAHVSIKLCAVLSIALWAALGPLLLFAGSGHRRKPTAVECKTEDSEVLYVMMVVIFWATAQYLVFICYFCAKAHVREKEPVLEASTSVNATAAVAIVVVIAFKISIACYYIFAYHPRSIPSILLLTIIGLLFLLFSHFMDVLRANLHPFNCKLAWVCVGLAAYLAATLAYLDFTTPDDLASGNSELETSNPTIEFAQTISADKEQNVSSIMLFKEGTAAQDGTFERIRFPLMRVCWVIICHLMLLTFHFVMACIEESDNKRRRSSSAPVASSNSGKPAAKITWKPSSRSTC